MVIPEGWTERLLGDLASLSTAPAKKSGGSRYVIVDMGSVGKDGSLLTHKMTDEAVDVLQVGDLAMPKDDIGGGQIIGKAIHIDSPDRYVLGDHVYRLRLSEGHPPYVRYAINSHSVNSSLRSKVVGSAQLGLGRRSVLEQPILFPSIAEQHAIAEALSDADALVNSLDALIFKKRDMKHATMQMLLSGTRRFTEFSDAWITARLGDSVRFVAGTYLPANTYGDGEFQVEGAGGPMGSTDKRNVTESASVIGRVGTIGKPRYYGSGCWVNNNAGAVIAVDSMDPVFLQYVLETVDFTRFSTTTAQPFLAVSDFMDFEFTRPSESEQALIGDVLRAVDNEIDALVAQRKKAERVKQGMMQELLTGRVRLA